jgi:peptidoglycan hydrolase-like protein with peptidoglycan-binding domain
MEAASRVLPEDKGGRDGYYDGPIDGILGPMARDAIAAFQADNGLAVTAAIDEPTLATLKIA